MSDFENRDWTRCLELAEESSEFKDAFNKEFNLLTTLASERMLGEHVTVMCCGDGREIGLILDLQRDYPQVKQITGVDLLDISIQQVRQKVKSRVDDISAVGITLLIEDATKTSIPLESQDTVMCMLTMVNFDDKLISAMFEHVQEILKPGGKFIFSLYNHQAFDARYNLYSDVGVPFVDSDRDSGLFTFAEGWEEASFSRQFTESQVREIVEKSPLEFSHFDTKGITHIAVIEKTKSSKQYTTFVKASWFSRAAVAASIVFSVGGLSDFANAQFARETRECHGVYRIMEIAPGVTHGFCLTNEER